MSLLSQADRELGRLDMYSGYVPDIDLFIQMHVVKEANQSSRIEGTQTHIEEIFQDKQTVNAEKRDDWQEVQNYIEALHTAIGLLQELPISTRLIKRIHTVLLQGARGQQKLPGEFRRSQNWIGGASLRDARFIPPVHNTVGEYMNDLEKFIHNEALFFPDLLKVALVHYQFETIHPFLDGNGRLGRLLIILYLVEKQILKKPVLYLSDFFERHRTLYYDNLTRVRVNNDIGQWFRFFLTGVIETARNSITTFDSILQLKKETDEKLYKLGARGQNAQKLVNYLYQNPVVGVRKVKTVVQISMPTAYKLIDDLQQTGILKPIPSQTRTKQYAFSQYLRLFE